MTVSFTTQHWIDFYSMTLDRLAEGLVDPKANYARLGIENAEGAAPMPDPLVMSRYKELMASWKNVRQTILMFGLEVGEDLELAPLSVNTQTWLDDPFKWFEVSRPGDMVPIKFYGRDAVTAFGFINFFIQHCEAVDPTKKIRDSLMAQGITKENFFREVGLAGIADPWVNERGADATEPEPTKDAPYTVLSPDDSVDRTPIQFPPSESPPTSP